MVYFSERRKYKRYDSTICKVQVSTDRKRWAEIDLIDISAGGLKFSSKNTYGESDPLYVHLMVYNMLSEFSMNFDARLIRTQKAGDKNIYAARFCGMNKYNQIQLDEIIKSKISVANLKEPVMEDGTYTFLLIPRTRPSKLRISRYK